MTRNMNVYDKFTDIYSYIKNILFLVVLMTLGATNALGITITYHIINLGRLNDDGTISTTRTEALQFTSTETTLGVPDKYKSPLAKNWKYYQATEITYNGSTKAYTFNSGPTLNEGHVMAADADIYVTYELDETALSNFIVNDGDVCNIKFNNSKYLYQSAWEGDPNTASAVIADPTTTPEYCWKINIKDPYQVTIQSKSSSYKDYYLSAKNGAFPDIRLRNPLSNAKANKVWAFGLIPGVADDTYRLIVADGYTQNHNTLDSFKHGYLNNNDQGFKTRFSTYNGESHSNCDLTLEPTQQTYTYHIVDTHDNIAISYTMPEATPVGEALNGYSSIPAAIRSPYLVGEGITFYNHADCADQHGITKTPPTKNIYVKYTTTNLNNKFLHLRGARALNVKINGELICDDNGSLSHQTGNENTTKPFLWYFSGEDPYAIEISNDESGKKLGYTTPSSSPTSLLYAESPEKTKFIIMATSNGDGYQQMELMAATGDGNYYRVGRTGDAFSISTTATGDASLQIKVNPVTIPATFKLIDKAGKILTSITSTSGDVELPDEWKSPLVSEYQYWKESAFTIEGDVYTLKANPSESDKAQSVTDNPIIYVTYKVNDKVNFETTDETTDDDNVGGTYRLQFINGESFQQENGKDAVMTTAQKGVYPYFCGDGMFYVYGDDQWETQLNSGASTRSRWLWYVVSPTSDPYHVKIMSNQLNAKPIDKKHGYFRTFPVTYRDLSTQTNVTRYVTSLTTTAEDDGAPSPTEYMVLTGAGGHCKLVTFDEIADAPVNGSYGTRQTVKTLEQYWKNNPTIQNTLGGAKVTQEETYSGNITLTDQQEAILPTYWHTYKSLVNSAPWVGWTGDGHSGTGRQYKNKNHWFQTINMSDTEGSDGEFEFVETTLTPQVILIDNHGWEIMRKPLYDKDGNLNTELKLYDSEMVKTYYWHPKSTKIDGYHKYSIAEGDEQITIYKKNEAGKWVPDGNTTTFTSNSLYDDPYVKIKNEYQEQDASVKTDFYVTYDVKPEYANLYKGAATESEVTVSAFWVKQGTKYAKNDGDALTTVDAETDDDELKWYVKPNFNIDAEMGYQYEGQNGEKTKNETEAEYVAAGKNGFDPYNVQIQSVKNTYYYFKITTSANSQLSEGVWKGSSTDLSLKQMSSGTQNNVEGYDQTNLNITNATFMVVKDESGRMLLMPRFDHTKVVNSFSGEQLSAPNAASQTLELKMAPKVIHYSSEFAGMNGQYFLASDFTFDEDFVSLGSAEDPFTGSIDGGLHPISTDPETPLTTPLIAYAEGAIIKNIILDNVNITTGTNVGAIVANATGETRIYNCGINSGSVGGSGDVGGIVGNLHGEEITVDGKKKYIGARVINCYSYANVTSGTNVGGIVGNNDFASTASKIATMVMNCMFYGDITGGTNKSPVYGGNNIANLHGGLNTYNYYAYQKLPTAHITDGKYNSALAIYEKYLNRFEFYRLLLNSNKKLAAFYATSSKETVKPSDMMKWVLETADRSIAEPKPYPVLKSQGYYPSIINYDAENAPDSASVGRNHGGKLGKTLRVHLSGTGITTSELTLQRMDKDFDRFNFNYDKVQLPYFNEVGTGNYTNNQVVTGWEITRMDGGTAGTYSAADEFGGYNFADRKCTAKDIYATSGRVFSQGAYFDVPYGVTDIYIQPHWATAVYVADERLDVVYNTGYTAQNVSQLDQQFPTGKITINGSEQDVYTSISAAIEGKSSSSVYDLAVVLVGNLHQSNVPSGGAVPFTVMSADLDNDHEPDYSMIYHHSGRTVICPIRFDFLNIPGTCQAQKPNGVSKILNFTIFKTKGWFETTNTTLVYSNQVEYENKEGVGTKASSPLILLGGDFEQFVSTQKQTVDGKTTYIHVGSNVNIDNFGLGTHGDGANATPHIPVSVTGGEFKGFYLTGTYNPNAAVKTDNAECYISGGHFVEAAGACQEQINGNVQWQIYDADIDAFFGGGINDAKPITGTITTEIINSHVGTFCGGPKFGNMTTGKAVTTTAIGCVFDEYFGAGYGGLSYSRIKYNDDRSYNFDSTPYQSERGKYYTGTGANTSYAKKGPGVATDFDYEFFVWSTGETGSRKYVKFASFSLAQCNDVSSNLTNCTINQSFYGGGSLGKVTGKATSVLDGCTVHGNVFGGGFSANVPKVPVRDKGTGLSVKPSYNSNTGMFEPGEFSGTTNYEWKHVDNLPADGGAGFVTEDDKNYVVTSADLTTLGQVKETDLTVKNNCLVEGAVYGGGDESAVYENTKVTIQNEGGSNKIPNVYGGGNTADVDGNTEVHMMNGTVSHDIYGGGRGETTIVGGNVMVNIGGKTVEAPSITYSGTGLVEGDVYGGSALGAVNTTDGKTTTVNVYGGTVNGSVFGGGLGQKAADAVAESGTPGDPGYVAPQAAIPEIVALSQGNVLVNVEGGTVKTAVYGGSNINGVLQKDATVTLIGGTVGDSGNPNNDVVFGGGKGAPTLVNGDVTVNVGEEGQDVATGATIHGHVYGGGALGNTNEEWVTDTSTEPATTTLQPVANTKTLVNLYAGTINGYAYGGGLGDLASLGEGHADTPAYVGGDVKVTLDGAKVQQVFGANNISGTPKGHVKVWVKRTVNSAKPTEDGEHNPIGREGRTTYDVQAVYGGGNQADYIPSDASSAFTEVIIEGCELTSIDKVYGGGNAAAVPATKVTVKGSYIINTLYGGGNGAGEGNLGANVGYKSYSSLTPTEEEKTSKQYGTGKAETKLLGGYINDVYGGSNTRGDVRGGTDVRTKGKDEVVADCCETLNVGNIYGAGSHADVKGDANILLECMPEDYVAAVYGGAEEAIVEGNVTLTVTSGKFGRVFGGNNKGGSIQGSITVVAKEEGCKPLEIGELYGGGNEAPYSHFGCTKVGETWTPKTTGTDYTAGKDHAIEVIVESCTSIGKVFGGGNEATVIGNTHVDINLFRGLVEGNPDFRPLGKIGQVFGGGNLAKVTGNTTVDIGTDGEYVNPETSTVDEGQKKGVKIESGDNYLKTLVDDRQTITAGIYGGGNDADVEGNTTLNIGTAYQTLGININGDIFGGGLGKDTHVTGNVTVNIGTNAGTVETPNYVGYAQITGDVYGGSAKGTVNSADNVNATTDSYTKVNFYGGTIKDTDTPSGKGNIYGGGEGQRAADAMPAVLYTAEDPEVIDGSKQVGDVKTPAQAAVSEIAANVFGTVTVTTLGGTVNKVFGCNNYFGAPQNTVDVYINGGTVNNSVYGGGNLAAYSAPDGSKDYPAVHINHGTVTENVFGGGYGLPAVVTGNPHITIGDGVEGHVVAIKKSVYGGGELAGVTGDTYIVMNNGTIGTEGQGGAFYGNIYGGGLGTEDTSEMTEAQAVQQAGIIKGNTNITVNGGTVLHNIYGGGANGSVGTFTYDGNNVITGRTSGGVANITILGGTIGTDGHENGMIFGASRGDVGKPGEIQDKLAWVYDTNVTIGNNESANPQIKGSVYGSGENGHTYRNAAVNIHSGMVGITDVSIDGGAAYLYRGNVYGGGCGTDKYTGDDSNKHYNLTAGIVGTTTALGTTTVTIDGGHVVRNVYGGGAMGSVTGGTTVNISGNSVIGADGSGGGYVYAASRGYDDMEAGFATVGSTTLNISGGTIWQSAFGGGQLGTVKGSVAVTVSGGVVKNDVYGGGALANTNTDNWNTATNNWNDASTGTYYAEVKHLKKDESPVVGYYTRSGESEPYTYTPASGTADGTSKYYKKLDGFLNVAANGTDKKTTLSLTGGTIGNAYGGGLGRLAAGAISAVYTAVSNGTTLTKDKKYYTSNTGDGEFTSNGTEIANGTNYFELTTPAAAAVSAVEAMVYGDISVTVNGTKFTKETERVDGKAVPVTGRVFGCNNLNGTPKGSVLVHVISTHRLDDGAHVKNQFEIQGVYGGGNMSNYEPKTYDENTEFGQHTKVIIDGCDNTSIERVYGGGNASNVPLTDVTIEGAFQIGYVFGGGNGGDKINKGTGAGWESNPGANVLPGYTNVVLHGGTIGEAFGGSDSKGIVGGSELTQDAKPGCPLVINNMYGASKEAETDNDVILNLAGCENSVVDKVFGGSYNADVRGNITINVYNGIYTSIFGGNDRQGTIGGNITINVEEVDECMPIIIQNLVGGGSQADYPGVDSDGNPAKAYKGAPYERGYAEHPASYEDFTSGNITINVKAATRIDRIFGGCDNAAATGTTTVNINMVKGSKAGDTYTLPAGYTGNAIPNLVAGRIKDEIGTIGDVYGGGNEGDVVGNSAVNICTEKDITFTKSEGHVPVHLTPNDAGKYDVLGAHIDGDVFGGGNKGNVTGNATVNICTADYSGTTGFEGVSIGESVYGGGSEADVLGNTSVTMSGGNRLEVDGAYVYDGVYGGGLKGSVGTFTRTTSVTTESNGFDHSTHSATCLGKPTACADGTGTCTVVVSGGQVGPVEVATKGMKNTGGDGPVDVGFVFGAGRGDVENPNDVKDADFHTYVDKTDVTISGGLIMASVYGGGENGRVLHDTHVTISGGQIGCGEAPGNVPKVYSESDWNSETPATFKECLSWDYKSPFLPHDPYAQIGDKEDAKEGTDGHTYYGSVFGGGSGYYPYLVKNLQGNVIGHEWLRSAGAVYGNTVIDITGGHILTCVYGGNETTDVGTYSNNAKGQPLVHVSGGKCTINMVGGTLGVPRTDVDAQAHPVTCYLFGAGKGDQRTHFNTWTNVQETEVNVSGTARIFGSVFGGGEDGHILGDAQVNIGGSVTIGETTYTAQSGLKIGTMGTSYVDGNVFGGGRGFSGLALTAGSTGGNAEVNIAGGTMLGSIYGGGRLASVGIDFTPPTDPLYGQLVDDTNEKTHGHITVNISGGTIGNDVANAKYGGNVFGGSMGRITLLDGTLNPIWPKQAVTKDTEITITGNALIKRNVYGGSEYGIVRDKAIVTIGGTRNPSTGVVTPSGTPTIQGSVFGAGYGSDDNTPTFITAGDYAPGADYVFTPMIWTGCVSGDTEVNIAGGTVEKNVYGGGEVASVGLINCHVVEDANGDIIIKDENNVEKKYRYTNLTKHNDIQGTGANEKAYGFALSWPYKFEFISGDPRRPENIGGKATVNITGGHIGSTTWDDRTGYVFGGSKGQVAFKKKVKNNLGVLVDEDITDIHEQRYIEGLCANVRETEVNVNYSSTPSEKTPSNIGAEANCIMGAVYGGGEDGHVYENAAVNITGGLIGLSVYGGGKGEGTYTGTKYVYNESTKTWTLTENVANMPSWTAGKVYGNTSITMSNGHVMGNVYGGGNLGSVGKGNYAGGTDDYYPAGYGETLQNAPLWTKTEGFDPNAEITESNKPTTMADYFLSSGKCKISITGGTVGTLNGLYGYVYGTSKGTPTGIVFGGSRGRAAQDVGRLSPRYEYAPDFFMGYVNNTEVTIGTRNADSGPRIYSQVFGGARDGHVRGSAKVEVNSGKIGQTYAETEAVGTTDVDYQRYHRGNVYGAGSGLGTWNGTNHGTSSGSVTRNTTVDIYGGTIYNNVYGGGAMATVGPPLIGTSEFASSDWSKCTVNIYGGTIGDPTVYDTYKYGGTIYGGSRGDRGGDLASGETIENYATVLWTEVNINPHPTNRNKDAVIAGNVYGGARGGQVKKDTKVNLLGGVIKHNAYGGGRGTTDIPADVLGKTTTELNKGVAADAKGCMVDKVYGCNDLNGTPKGHVLVHVYGTQNRDKDDMQTKVGPGSRTSLDQGKSEGYIVYMNRLIALAKNEGVVKPGITESVITAAQATITGKEEASLSDGEKTAISNAAKNVIAELQNLHVYDVTAVYGGGDLAPYVPTVSEETTQVIIEGCDVTSIKQVYGGGNAAYAPATNVLVKSAYVIDELFGGGNGLDNYKKDTDGKWYENPGANVGYKQLAYYDTSGSHGTGADEANKYTAITYTDPDATTKAGRIANYSIGTGVASTTVNGGYIHNVYGGSNVKGNIRREALLQIQQAGTCPLVTDEIYAGSKSALIDAETNTVLDCVKEGGNMYGGSYNADILNDVHVRITNGKYGKVFGGNNKAGTITGSITIDIEENGCTPIEIDELYAGGYLAPYSIYGYSATTRDAIDENGDVIWVDPSDHSKGKIQQRIPYKKGDAGALATPSRDPQINIISATKIGKIYGGGYQADLIGSPHINVNMTKGIIIQKYASDYPNGEYPYITAVDAEGNKIIPVGTIGTIFGGGNKGDVYGDTHVEIGTGTHHNADGEEEVITPARNAAFIFRDGTGGQVFGGGDQGYVFGNTNVNIGNGYIYDRVYGGGNEGTVGTVLTRALPEGHSHTTGCLGGKPTAFATGTGKSTVTVSGGYVGPYSYVRSASTGTATITPMTMPQDFGYVFAAGRGKMGNPAVAGNEDIEFMTYVNETNVIIKNTYAEAFEGDSLAHIVRSPLIAGGVYGGSENGRVLNNTHVNIWGGQIGLGATKTAAYAEADFIDPTTATAEQIAAKAATMAECASWAYGHDSNSDSKNDEWLPYDEHAGNGHYQTEAYGAASTTGYDGHTFYGNVFGGGSGYFAYETETTGVYEWLPSAGLVEGDTYVNISGGHILTNVYGGNEMTNVTGTAHVTMTGGTLGVPRTLAQIAEHPVTCYLFGGGKGDQRVHFNKSTNVGHAVVNVSGGIIYGSVFGGGEDGHVLGDVTMNISDGTKIGTWGTSYVDGNVFGGGRGFGGDAYTAGNIAGTVTMNITGGTMLGSIYGGGRLGSVGYGLFSKNETGYGEMMADNVTEDGFTPPGGLTKGRGHVTVNISGDNTVIGNKYEYQYISPETTGDALATAKTYLPSTQFESNNRLKHTRGGNVFAGGMGRYTKLDGTSPISTYDGSGNLTSPIEWKKLGNVKSTKLTISGNPWIMGNVYGGGELGSVLGSHNVLDESGNPVIVDENNVVTGTEIIIKGGTIGTEVTGETPVKAVDVPATYPTEGNSAVKYTYGSVYGGGEGREEHDTSKDEAHGGNVISNARVNISGTTKVRASVFGGGELALVGGDTYVNIIGGEIGRNEVKALNDANAGYVMFGGATMGNVYGGGKGSLGHFHTGQVKGNTNVNITGGNVYHMVYGGGAFPQEVLLPIFLMLVFLITGRQALVRPLSPLREEPSVSADVTMVSSSVHRVVV